MLKVKIKKVVYISESKEKGKKEKKLYRKLVIFSKRATSFGVTWKCT